MSLPALLNLAGPVNWLDPLSRGLRAWWLCVPGLMSGSRWVDLCATSNNQTLHGTLAGGAFFGDSLNRVGGWGRVLFDGTDDTVTIANLPLMGNDATLCCWVNGTSFAANKTLFCAQNGASDNSLTMECGRTANRLSVLHSGSAVHTGSNNVPGTNVWFHAAFTRTGSSGSWTVTTYINGLLDSSTGSIATNPYPLATPNVRIGTNPGIAGRYLSGAMDDVRIYSRCLSAGEIRQVYLNSRTGHQGLLNRLVVGRLAEAAAAGDAQMLAVLATASALSYAGSMSGGAQMAASVAAASALELSASLLGGAQIDANVVTAIADSLTASLLGGATLSAALQTATVQAYAATASGGAQLSPEVQTATAQALTAVLSGSGGAQMSAGVATAAALLYAVLMQAQATFVLMTGERLADRQTGSRPGETISANRLAETLSGTRLRN